MDKRLSGAFSVKEIVDDDNAPRLRDTGKSVIGEISLKTYINGVEYASLLCLNQLTEELAMQSVLGKSGTGERWLCRSRYHPAGQPPGQRKY